MDLRKILDRKELEARDSNDVENYIEEHPVDFKGYKIPLTEYNTLEEIASNLGETVDCFRIEEIRYCGSFKKLKIEINENHINSLQIDCYPYLKNTLEKVLDSMKNLEQLEYLNLTWSGLRNLSENIGDLTNLKELRLIFNGLVNIPATIGNLKQLECLDLSYNELTYLPGSIGDLKNLKKMYLTENKFGFKERHRIKRAVKKGKSGVKVWT